MDRGDRDAIAAVLDFWLGNGSDAEIRARSASLWWRKDPATDAAIRERFGALRERAVGGALAHWEETAPGRLALIILVDQFSRNLFRDSPQAFAFDELARRWCVEGLAAGMDRELPLSGRIFFYLPLEHSESLEDQERSVSLFADLLAEAPDSLRSVFVNCLDFARRHRDIILRFGRFPHRNAVLG